MRDMTMVKNARSDTAQGEYSAAPSAIPHLSAPELLEARNKLMQGLQISQEPREIIAVFFSHLENILGAQGLRYHFNHDETLKLGREAVHHCDYRLHVADTYLGEIFLSRSKRFADEELALLESLLAHLVYPLRNALRYQDAIALALQDPLTELGNRIALDKALRQELQLAERYDQDLSLLMIDIDHFKLINDKHGHSRGDQVLREVASRIQTVCRESDITFRYGGEEFVVLLRKTGTSGALIIAERLRREIAKLRFGEDKNSFATTVSIGVGSRGRDKEKIDAIFERADKALYYAKANGRNCIMNLQAVS